MKYKDHPFNTPLAQVMWKMSDDAIKKHTYLGDIYGAKTPKDLYDIRVDVMELHILRCKKPLKKKVLKWLNNNRGNKI